MSKTLLFTAIAVVGLSIGAMAQKDSASIKVKKDTIKTKQTGALILNGHMLAFGPQADTTKAKTKTKQVTKPDTSKTGSLKSTDILFYAVSPQTDSLKAKPKAVDTVKTGTKYAVAYHSEDGPLTDSTKTKPATVKPDTTTTKPGSKRIGAIQIDRSLVKSEILEA